jgi:hypothetical protein
VKVSTPTFLAITSTGGYIGRIYWTNSGVHPDFPRWGSVQAIPDSMPDSPWSVWAGLFPVVRQIINWRFCESSNRR